jgi:hypothetical protein
VLQQRLETLQEEAFKHKSFSKGRDAALVKSFVEW